MELKNGIQTYHAKSRADWRKWLEQNHATEKSVWLIIYHKKSKTPSVGYEESVEEALCYGWVDSRTNKRDEESYYIYYCKRKLTGYWSRSNRERVEKLLAQGLITEAGQILIDIAKQKGTWTHNCPNHFIKQKSSNSIIFVVANTANTKELFYGYKDR